MNKTSNPRKNSVTIRLTDAELKLLKSRADKHNEKTGTYIRNCALTPNRRKDAVYCRDSKPIIRDMQTSFNMINQNIDVDNQKNNIIQEAKQLCSILQSSQTTTQTKVPFWA